MIGINRQGLHFGLCALPYSPAFSNTSKTQRLSGKATALACNPNNDQRDPTKAHSLLARPPRQARASKGPRYSPMSGLREVCPAALSALTRGIQIPARSSATRVRERMGPGIEIEPESVTVEAISPCV